MKKVIGLMKVPSRPRLLNLNMICYYFIAENSRNMPPWKRDILEIIHMEAEYFIPQMQTKIMNEGWASFWHYRADA